MVLPDGEIYSGESNLVLPYQLNQKSKVHHGHLVVRTAIPVRYSSRKTGEDGDLVVKILGNGFRLVYVDAKLSIYDRFDFSNIANAVLGHARVTVSRIYRFFFKLKSNK
jgi:hypothetical protein